MSEAFLHLCSLNTSSTLVLYVVSDGSGKKVGRRRAMQIKWGSEGLLQCTGIYFLWVYRNLSKCTMPAQSLSQTWQGPLLLHQGWYLHCQEEPVLTEVPKGSAAGQACLSCVSNHESAYPLLHFKVRLTYLQFRGKLSKGENSAYCFGIDKQMPTFLKSKGRGNYM